MADYFRPGIMKVYWVPTITTLAAATAAQITAGTHLSVDSGGLMDLAGFSFSNSPIPVPKVASAYVGKIPGRDEAVDSTLTFSEDKVTNPLQTTLAKGTVGFIVIFFAGIAGGAPAAADKYEGWPCVIAGWHRDYSTGNDPAKWVVDISSSSPPAQNGVVAA